LLDAHVKQEGPKNQAHEDVYVAVRDAFDAATRRGPKGFQALSFSKSLIVLKNLILPRRS
jgi:hypothetical protein